MEIRCTACRHLTLARAEPVYEDFKKIAETFVCTACGHRYASREQTPFVDADGRPRVFSEADKPEAVKVFQADERRRSCAWCRYFIVNPFSQRCGLNNRQVDATDICARFAAKPDQPSGATERSAGNVVSRFDALFGKEAPAAPAESAPRDLPAEPAPQEVPAPTPAAVSTEKAPKKAPPRKRAVSPADCATKAPTDKKPVGRPRKKKAE